MTGPAPRQKEAGAWVETWLSTPRFARYLHEVGGDRQRALDFYEWNLQLGAALMRDIAHVEVAVRNAYDNVMNTHWQGEQHWLFDPSSPVLAPLWRMRRGRRTNLNARNRATASDAIRRCGGASAKSGEVIAELSFGFWRHCTDAANEKSLWVPYLHRTWPKKTSRVALERSLTTINTARNRASHHEPLFASQPGRDLAAAHREMLRLSGMLLPELAVYFQDTTTLPAILATRLSRLAVFILIESSLTDHRARRFASSARSTRKVYSPPTSSTVSERVSSIRLGVAQPRISDLVRLKIDLFSLDALANMVAAAGMRLEMSVHHAAA